jgi:hypothetical protein
MRGSCQRADYSINVMQSHLRKKNMRSTMIFSALLSLFSVNFAHAQMAPVNAYITDGTKDFAEGIMTGWELQVDGVTLCVSPYVIGRYITCNTVLKVDGKTYQANTETRVWPNTNGGLGAMVIVDAAGRIACSDPMTWARGPAVYCNR